MIISRRKNFRNYYVDICSVEYKVNKIHFYRNNEIVVTVNKGWLINQNGEDITSLEIPVSEIYFKSVQILDGSVSVILVEREMYTNELLVELYIPADMFNIHFVENILVDKRIKAIYEGDGICVEKHVKWIDDELYKIKKEYEAMYEKCNSYKLTYSVSRESAPLSLEVDDILEKLDKLKEIATRYLEERKRVEEFTIDDYKGE